MTKRNSLTMLLAGAALLVVGAAGPANAQMMEMSRHQQHGPGHAAMAAPGDVDRMGEMMGGCLVHAGQLGLSEDQLLKMKPLHRDQQKKQARYQADRKIAEIELAEVLDVKDFDLEKAGAAVKKSAEIWTAHNLDTLKSMKEMRSILTDEQYKEMSKLMTEKQPGKMPAHKAMKKHK
jgi:Spy/CpxP family protein refolding chaperone